MSSALARPLTVCARLHASAEAHPDRVALEVGRERSTYAALSLAGRALAATLQLLPRRPCTRTLVVLARAGQSGVRALVGGWLAGLAVAPISCDIPAEQLAHAIRASSPTAVFVDGASRSLISALLPLLPAGLPVILLDAAEARTLRGLGGRTPVLVVDRRAVADWRPVAVRPAAVAAHLWDLDRDGGHWVARTHAALLDDVERHAVWQGIHGGDRVSHLHPLDSIRGLIDLLLPWSMGGVACAPGIEDRIGVWLRASRLSVLRLTPTRLRAMEAAGALVPAILSTVRVVSLEGEGHRGADVATLRGALPEAVVDSIYGRVEVGSSVFVHRIQPGPRPEADAVTPLGRPFPGVRIAVVDADGRPVAEGTAGRLVVRGPAGEAVVTTDGVQVVDGGNLRHLGSSDDRIQLRGRRISLDAIGGVVAGVVQAPVVVVGWPLSAPGSALGLVAFIQTGHVDAAEVTRSASALLPRGLVPTELLAVPGLPFRADGGPDRRRLTRFLAGRGFS